MVDQWMPKNNSTTYSKTPTIIITTPKGSIISGSPVTASMIFPPVTEIQPKIINRPGTPYTKTLIITANDISIHPNFVSFDSLKQLWASLSSKAQLLGCVFDTPDGDARPINYRGEKEKKAGGESV